MTSLNYLVGAGAEHNNTVFFSLGKFRELLCLLYPPPSPLMPYWQNSSNGTGFENTNMPAKPKLYNVYTKAEARDKVVLGPTSLFDTQSVLLSNSDSHVQSIG